MNRVAPTRIARAAHSALDAQADWKIESA